MSVLLRQITRYVIQKAKSDPAARDKALKIASGVAKQASAISKTDDPAYAAGRALRRALNNLQKDR